MESELGRGSTFHFTIDFTLGEPAGAGVSATLAGAARMADVPREELRLVPWGAKRRLHVLVVDDDPVSAEIARDALERRGHAVAVAKTGREAIEAFERADFDAVLMDVQLPDIGGLAITAALRDRERRGRGRARIVALTASAMPGDRERCLAAGVDVYLAKPLGPRALIAAIEAIPRDEELPLVAEPDSNVRAGTQMARLFLTEAPRQLDDLRGAVARRDPVALSWAAHRLKSAIANFAPSPAFDAAERLDALAGSDESAGADVDWAAVEEQLGYLTAALTALLEQIRQTDHQMAGVNPPPERRGQ